MIIIWKWMLDYLYFALFWLLLLALESFTLFNIIYMSNNLNWFESPVRKTSNYNSLPLCWTDYDAENDQQQWRSSTFFSPEPVSSGFKPCHGSLESPWSSLFNEGLENREHELSLLGFLPAEQHKETYDRHLSFSDKEDNDEEEELITPVRQETSVKEDHSEAELHTTGKKSQGEAACLAKKSRPREKGLRKLSQRAYEIVQELKNATYKEVAAKLVQQLNEDQFDTQNKEQQNIKRRVYDALNVLIALGVLRKDGRKIVSDKTSKQSKTKFAHDKELQVLRQRIVSKSLAVEEKLKEFKLAAQKRKEIAFLLERNKNPSFFNDYKITFPFIGVCCSAQEIDKLTLPRADFLLLRSKSALRPFGDMDTLKFFKKSVETDQSEETQQY